MAGLGMPQQPKPNSYFGMAYNPAQPTNTMVGNTGQNRNENGTVNYSPQNMYNSALPQTAHDYDSIMQGYRGVLNNAQTNRPDNSTLRNTLTSDLNRPDVQSSDVRYRPTDDVNNAMSRLGTYSENGGYSDADVADLRARGISPIRSMYANANRNLNRQRSLQGGYAPGMAAATTRMAREQSQLMADRVTDVNASIADKRAAGRRDMAGAYGNLASSESGRYLSTDTGNADRKLEAARTNAATRGNTINSLTQLAQLDSAPNRDSLAALEGMRTLYGTTPALANTFGSQAMGATQNAQNQQQQGFNNKITANNAIRQSYGNQYQNMGRV